MQLNQRLIRSLFFMLVTGALSLPAQASLESEQAALAQLTQALEDARGSLKALEEEAASNQKKAEEEQKAVLEATTAKDSAEAALNALKSAKPGPDTERKIKDAEYEFMMAERKLSSAQKAMERAQKKLLDGVDEQKSLRQQIAQTEKAVADQKGLVEKVKSSASGQASQKAAEEAARKEAEARAAQLAAQQKAAEETARQSAAAEEQAKKQAMMKQLGVDLSNCIPLPASVASTEITAVDVQLQAFAQGELRRVNRLVSEKADNDTPPLSPTPVLGGNKLKPCEVEQWQALKFAYLGNGQYRLETPVVAGEQEFSVKGVIDPIHRTIPDSDNGAVYVFFLDVKFEGRYKLSAYKKSLFDQAPQP